MTSHVGEGWPLVSGKSLLPPVRGGAPAESISLAEGDQMGESLLSPGHPRHPSRNKDMLHGAIGQKSRAMKGVKKRQRRRRTIIANNRGGRHI